MIELRNVHKRFGDVEVLRGIDMAVREGQILALIGPSGSGKSTLLRSINQLETIEQGEIWLDGRMVNQPLTGRRFEKHINSVRQDVGMVFQHFNLFHHLTVMQNITLAPMLVKKLPADQAQERARGLLDKVGLLDRVDAYPAQLSGGQKQRVAIARALAMQPKAMLFDEATSSLDPELVEEVNKVMKQLAKERMTMMIVTHELRFAAEVADYVIFMADGVIVEQGPPQKLFYEPTHERTRTFLRKTFH